MSRLLLFGDSYRNPNLFYRTGFNIPDPAIYFEQDGHAVLAVSAFEVERARKESRVEDVRDFDSLGYLEALSKTGESVDGQAAVVMSLAGSSDEPIQVSDSFPVLLADRLRAQGLDLVPDPNLIIQERRIKRNDEIENIARSQARAEAAVSQARDILTESEIVNDSLIYRGVPLTTERLRGEIDAAFASDNFSSDGMIIACGPGGADPHWSGAGLIRPNQTIIFDIFPQDRSTRYFGDVTRTFVKGTASPYLLVMHETVLKAQTAALKMIGPGVDGKDVHETVMGTFAEAGFRDDGEYAARQFHGTGHGVGIEIHESPRLGRAGDVLKPGDVVTVEPGLYDPTVGGIRIEDVVVVTEDGNRNLNRLPKDLVIP